MSELILAELDHCLDRDDVVLSKQSYGYSIRRQAGNWSELHETLTAAIASLSVELFGDVARAALAAEPITEDKLRAIGGEPHYDAIRLCRDGLNGDIRIKRDGLEWGVYCGLSRMRLVTTMPQLVALLAALGIERKET